MANWAIVIGVDRYWLPEACLQGAVRDALGMCDWLLDENGGGVQRKNLTLLLAPNLATPSTDLNWTEAKRDDIVEAIERLLAKSGGKGERFFFHFSGHGLTARINFINQAGIVPPDFIDTLPDKALTVLSLFDLFQATRFKEQFFFIDACRNLPFKAEKRLGDYPNPRQPEGPVSSQFVMFATQPGAKAIEIRRPGDERGAFTGALLKGLRGAGAAKRWDEERGGYVVRWNSLFEFVERDVKSRKLPAAKSPEGPLIQEPRQFGEKGSENPELSHFPKNAFTNEALTVDLRPQEVSNIARLEISEMAGMVDFKPPPLRSLPVPFNLPPRTYSVRAAAPGHISTRRYIQVDLYQPSQVEVELVPTRPAIAPGGGPSGPPSFLPPAGPGGGERYSEVRPESALEAATRGIEDPGSDAILVLMSGDPLAYLELTDSSGRILKSGRAPLVCDELAPGFYRGRLISPEGEAVEQLIDLPLGRTEFTLTAVQPQSALLQSIISRSDFDIRTDGTISPSEAVGPSASLRVSTVLALAAAAAAEADSPYGLRLRRLGLSSFQALVGKSAESGIQVVLADEACSWKEWKEVELRCWSMNESPLRAYEQLATVPGLEAIATTAMRRDPGAYWLWLRFRGSADLTVPVIVLPNRLSLVVLTFDKEGQADLHHYAPALTEGSSLPDDAPKDLDPLLQGPRFAALRRIELMQRSASNGRITPTWLDVELLLWNKWIDPVAGCLGGYLLVRMAKSKDLEVPVRNLTEFFGELPDAHVLKGVYLEAVRLGSASNAYAAALDHGLPIFREGLALLVSAIDRLGIRHERVALARNLLSSVPTGSLWSTIPETLEQVPFHDEVFSVRPRKVVAATEMATLADFTIVPERGQAIDSKFRFVLLAAKRAEQLMRSAKRKASATARIAPTRVAMEEIAAGLVEWGYGPRSDEVDSAGAKAVVSKPDEESLSAGA